MGHVQDREPPDGIVKHFTVAVFIVSAGHVLLHPHPKVGLWLPPGGHIEPHELPDDAALRETLEEPPTSRSGPTRSASVPRIPSE